uniref:Ig-like domain-containing protein n=1 Tax=Rhinolophus ferrumequinum TaxID=59479 RepID=A0A671FUI6_RHIFE
WFWALRAPATQISSNLEGRQISITRQSGSSVVIPCDIVNQNTNYVHWYRYQEGMAPRRLLYYEFSSSQFVVDQGVSSEKYHVYEGTGRSCKFVLRNLEEKDSGVYYCAVWMSGTHNVRAAKATYTTTIFRSVPTHILLSLGNHRGGTAGHPA